MVKYAILFLSALLLFVQSSAFAEGESAPKPKNKVNDKYVKIPPMSQFKNISTPQNPATAKGGMGTDQSSYWKLKSKKKGKNKSPTKVKQQTEAQATKE